MCCANALLATHQPYSPNYHAAIDDYSMVACLHSVKRLIVKCLREDMLKV